jgi:arsenate reductase-like glutaredoxin family protein
LQNELSLEERDYFKEPLSEEEVREMAGLAGIDQIFAKRSPSLKNMGLAGQQLSEDEMVRLMLQEPKLVRRPMMRIRDQLFVGGGAAVLDAVVSAAST